MSLAALLLFAILSTVFLCRYVGVMGTIGFLFIMLVIALVWGYGDIPSVNGSSLYRDLTQLSDPSETITRTPAFAGRGSFVARSLTDGQLTNCLRKSAAPAAVPSKPETIRTISFASALPPAPVLGMPGVVPVPPVLGMPGLVVTVPIGSHTPSTIS